MRYFIHSGSYGDIIYSLPSVISLDGGNLFLRTKYYSFFKELLEKQPYINEILKFEDFLRFKKLSNFNKIIKYDDLKIYNLDYYSNTYWKYVKRNPNLRLTESYLKTFNLSFDLSNIWLHNIEPIITKPIVISITPRYHDKEDLDYSILRNFQNEIICFGRRGDYKYFNEKTNIEADCYICNNGYEVAQVVKGSKLFIGNQSLGFALAEAMKIPRVLERYYTLNNCIPCSDNGYTYLSNKLIEDYLK